MKYLTAIYWEEQGKEKVCFEINPHSDPRDAAAYSQELADKLVGKKFLRSRTYEFGCSSFNLGSAP